MAKLTEEIAVSPALRDLLLDISLQPNLDAVLGVVVDRLRRLTDVALARIWLTRPGDICHACPMRAECPDQSNCLHLVASAGQPRHGDRAAWDRIDGEFRRFPLGVRKVGLCATQAQCVAGLNIQQDVRWIARPDWARAEGILGFAAQPLIHNARVLGVIAIFTRTELTLNCLDWLRMIADLVAASIANSRAMDEIEQLRDRLRVENEYLREEVSDALAFGDILGQSAALRTIVQQIELVAATDANVLILGESGTGKELVAQAIHRHSQRREHTLVRVNCASVPRELYESEFFGHAKGAFTGAVRDRVGRFELASGGTLFLDEVGEIPLDLQSKLLRVIQEGAYERVGEDRTRSTDVRIVAATNRDLRDEVEAGRFRQDLYYRLHVFPIEVPPLRQRKEDIPLLAREFVHRAARRFNRREVELTQANLLALQAYDWPGNVRELMNVVERAVITLRSKALRFDLPDASKRSRTASTQCNQGTVLSQDEIKRMERQNILAALNQVNWRVHGPEGAAALLGMQPTTLASRIKRMGLRREDADRR